MTKNPSGARAIQPLVRKSSIARGWYHSGAVGSSSARSATGASSRAGDRCTWASSVEVQQPADRRRRFGHGHPQEAPTGVRVLTLAEAADLLVVPTGIDRKVEDAPSGPPRGGERDGLPGQYGVGEFREDREGASKADHIDGAVRDDAPHRLGRTDPAAQHDGHPSEMPNLPRVFEEVGLAGQGGVLCHSSVALNRSLV